MKSNRNNAAAATSRTADHLHDPRLRSAHKRLAESKDQEDAIEGVREIVANFLGSEEMGLFRIDSRTGTFHVFWSFGIDLEEYDLLRALGDAGVQRVMRGECHVELGVRERGAPSKAQAFVPISVADQTIAILAILRLLPQKSTFDESDMELFKLLSNETAKPLFGSKGMRSQGMTDQGMIV